MSDQAGKSALEQMVMFSDSFGEANVSRVGAHSIASYVSTLEARLEKAEAERDAAIDQAYLLGFVNSGEGWNGEYPFDVERPDMNERWLKSRGEVLISLKSPS